MGVATVTGYEGEMVKLDEGGGAPALALLAGPSGDDSPPAIGDSVVVLTANGRTIVACIDNLNGPVATTGEVRRYSRNALGLPMAILHLRADGSVAIEAPGGLVLTGDLAVSGNLEVDGSITAAEVTAGVVPGATVTLTTHMHPTAAVGSPSPPTPGT